MTLHDGQQFISITIDAMEIKIWNTIIATSNPWLRKSIKKIMEKVGSKKHGSKHENMKSYTKIRIEKVFFFLDAIKLYKKTNVKIITYDWNNGSVCGKIVSVSAFNEYDECYVLASSGFLWAPERPRTLWCIIPVLLYHSYNLTPISTKMPDPMVHHTGIVIACKRPLPWGEETSISHYD